MKIDINSDLGESFGNYKMCSDDAEIMKYITSVNIACGFHAGDPRVIENTIKSALGNNVLIGAHPGYPDLAGFGRRSMRISNPELFSMIMYQVGAVKAMTEAFGGKLTHVKLHGAMYSDYTNDYNKAKVVCEAIYKIDPSLIFLGQPHSQMLQAARDIGLRTANEVFADRTYNDDGSLVSRLYEGAVIEDIEQSLKQVKQMITDESVQSINGNRVPIIADTICIHGDSERSLQFAITLKEFLVQNNIEIVDLKTLIG